MEKAVPEAPLELNYQSTLELEKQGRQAGLALLVCALYIALLGVAGVVGMLISAYWEPPPATPPIALLGAAAGIALPTAIIAALFLWSRRGLLRRSRRAVVGGRILSLGMCALFGFEGGAMSLAMVFERPRFDELLVVGSAAAVIFTGLVLFVWTAWLLGRVRRLL